MKEEKFLHTRKPHHGDWELWKFRLECSGVRGGSEGKLERIHHRNHCWIAHFLTEKQFTGYCHSSGWGQGAEAQVLVLDARERLEDACYLNTLKRLLWHSEESPEKRLGVTKWQKVFVHGTLMPHSQTMAECLPVAAKTRVPAVELDMTNIAKARESAWSIRQNAVDTVPIPEMATTSKLWSGTVTSCTFLGTYIAWLFLGTQDLGSTPLEKCTTYLRL